ncbi:WG repeat-containing protein [Bacillus sp. Marseille-P3661]|uniref:WG repeat-containing protein n=1 Tax=Bacillus sp. Marseille-P3661 TaxID=1936234 RepID=UPI002155DA64|nr:WG repeat-containing protein [Bacillus sp. Marseille-P3661]
MEKKKKSLTLYPAYSRIVNGERWGYINSKGNFMIQPQFELALDFQANDLAVVKENKKFGVINKSGHFILKPRYEAIQPFSEGRAVVKDAQGYKVIDERGNIVTSQTYRFIGTYENQRALFSKIGETGRSIYGYLDLQGNEVIPARFLAGEDFSKDKALVKIADNEYALIGRHGQILQTYHYPFVGNRGDGLLAFREEQGGPVGYIEENGNIVIQPQFTNAQPFENGAAVVYSSDTMHTGLINKSGSFVIKPQYELIHMLGEDRVSVGKKIESDLPFPIFGNVFAIATVDGRFLSDFEYYDVLDYEKGFASANNGEEAFFINKQGNIEPSLPVVEGTGTLYLEEELIKANVDKRLFYLDYDGNIVWLENSISLRHSSVIVMEIKYKPNKDYLVYYPRIVGMENKVAQESVNEKLKEIAQVIDIPSGVQLSGSYDSEFEVTFFKKNLLVIRTESYDYPFGTPHGMFSIRHSHINLQNGNFYELKDLFKENSDYVNVLGDILQEQLRMMEDPPFPPEYIKNAIDENQSFHISENTLNLYFRAAPAIGFPSFEIPFKEIKDIINTKGEFWQSFH